LAVRAHSGANAGTYFCGYDGNGNVAVLVNAADGSESARYEYGPFAEPIRATGLLAKENPFRFSTKYQDDETDLLYYGYRYYSFAAGRWLSRDPIGEAGSLNLFLFVSGDPMSLIDLLGLAEKCQEAVGADGRPRYIFTIAGKGWHISKVYFSGGTVGSAQAGAKMGVTVTWEADVSVLCNCKSCHEIRSGTRYFKRNIEGTFLVFDPSNLPMGYPLFDVVKGLPGAIAGLTELLLEHAGLYAMEDADIADLNHAVKEEEPADDPHEGWWKGRKSPCERK
jgi:RHS repeat-associated protein